MHRIHLLAAAIAAITAACQSRTSDAPGVDGANSTTMKPPVAKVEPKELVAHGETRIDDYYWLRERENPAVIEYLEAENAYTEAVLAPTKPLQEELYQEFLGRIQEDDETVHVPHGPYEYFSRTFAGKSYPVHYRMPRGGGEETVLFDVNRMARGHDFFSLSRRTPSPDHSHNAYAVDRVGRRLYDIEIQNVHRGDAERGIRGASGSMAWASDNRTLFYVMRDPETLRAYQVWKHEIGRHVRSDELVYEETDERFSCSVRRTRSGKFLMIDSHHTLSTETRFLAADDPDGEWRVVIPRRENHEYDVDHWHGSNRRGEIEHFYIRTNDQAENFRVVSAPIDAPEDWTSVIPHRLDTLVSGIEVFATHLVARERRGGLVRLKLYRLNGQDGLEIPFGDPTYQVSLAPMPDFDSLVVRYQYSSLSTPSSTYEYDLASTETKLLKQDAVGGGFSPDDYVVERVFAVAEDGSSIPISLVYKSPSGERPAEPGPLLLYGYGSYGSSIDASFSSTVLSLLDRGFTYAIAHVRGGQELGRYWYEQGKLQRKKNTFTDFIACAEHLVEEGLTEPTQLFARGGSAGGLLIGAVANMRPNLFHGLIAAVPFVDVVTTMLDESIPLTTFEWDEWGDPRRKADYDYMLSYSPYDQVQAQAYPNMLVTTGLHDSQVQYWEPAKWVAKLRAKRTGGGVLLFDCEMDAGHGGVSGRYGRLRDTARDYAFLLSLLEENGLPAR